MAILVTGGAGYIGSHTVVALLDAGFDLVVVDNLANSKAEVFERIGAIAGREPCFVEGDVRDAPLLDRIFEAHTIDAVIHFAGLKAVGESVAQPLLYYRNNLAGAITLCEAMVRHGCKKMVFSSSATVYGDPATVPIREDFPLAPANPYGQTKLVVENILRDIARSDPEWQVMVLRYFNPVGAHESGLIGEDPAGIPNNLLPFIAQVAIGRRQRLQVFGGDYPTRDGTGVRDYIHVVDLARGHLAALEKLAPGWEALNLGTGRGYSVLEVVHAFEKACGKAIPWKRVERRAGDIAECYADTSRSEHRLGWKARLGLEDMVRDHWRWQQGNPDGYP